MTKPPAAASVTPRTSVERKLRTSARAMTYATSGAAIRITMLQVSAVCSSNAVLTELVRCLTGCG